MAVRIASAAPGRRGAPQFQKLFRVESLFLLRWEGTQIGGSVTSSENILAFLGLTSRPEKKLHNSHPEGFVCMLNVSKGCFIGCCEELRKRGLWKFHVCEFSRSMAVHGLQWISPGSATLRHAVRRVRTTLMDPLCLNFLQLQ